MGWVQLGGVDCSFPWVNMPCSCGMGLLLFLECSYLYKAIMNDKNVSWCTCSIPLFEFYFTNILDFQKDCDYVNVKLKSIFFLLVLETFWQKHRDISFQSSFLTSRISLDSIMFKGFSITRFCQSMKITRNFSCSLFCARHWGKPLFWSVTFWHATSCLYGNVWLQYRRDLYKVDFLQKA